MPKACATPAEVAWPGVSVYATAQVPDGDRCWQPQPAAGQWCWQPVQADFGGPKPAWAVSTDGESWGSSEDVSTVGTASTAPSVDVSRCNWSPPVSPEPAVEAEEPLIPPQRPEDQGKLVVVLDLDETLVRFREGPVFWRPHLAAFLERIKSVCEVVLWTASTEECAARVMGDLDPNGDRFHHKIFRTDRWFRGVPYTKSLLRLGRDMTRTVIVENTVECVVSNPSNAVIVPDYILPNADDAALLVVRDICLDMVAPTVDVQQHLQQHGSLQGMFMPCGRVQFVTPDAQVAQRGVPQTCPEGVVQPADRLPEAPPQPEPAWATAVGWPSLQQQPPCFDLFGDAWHLQGQVQAEYD